jgi:hypothetical protein
MGVSGSERGVGGYRAGWVGVGVIHTGRSTAYWQGLRLDTVFCTVG